MSEAVIHNGVALSGRPGRHPGRTGQGQTAAVLAEVDRILALCGTDKTRILDRADLAVRHLDFRADDEVWECLGGARPLAGRWTGEARLATPDYRVEIIVTRPSDPGPLPARRCRRRRPRTGGLRNVNHVLTICPRIRLRRRGGPHPPGSGRSVSHDDKLSVGPARGDGALVRPRQPAGWASYAGSLAVYFGTLALALFAPLPGSQVAVLVVVNALAGVRLYVLQHDCGHGSLFEGAGE